MGCNWTRGQIISSFLAAAIPVQNFSDARVQRVEIKDLRALTLAGDTSVGVLKNQATLAIQSSSGPIRFLNIPQPDESEGWVKRPIPARPLINKFFQHEDVVFDAGPDELFLATSIFGIAYLAFGLRFGCCYLIAMSENTLRNDWIFTFAIRDRNRITALYRQPGDTLIAVTPLFSDVHIPLPPY